MNYIDLFAGCGGLSLGLYNAGWKGLFAVEKSHDAFETLKYNLIDRLNHFDWPEWLGEPGPLDIKKVIKNYSNELKALNGKVDLVTGGPPCQGFSTSGKRDEKDRRNKLILDYLKFINLVKPKIIFFENVRGFTMEFNKNKSKGMKYSTYVEKKLNEIGYKVCGDMIDFSEYGVPQKRCRFILVGIRIDIVEKNKIEAENFFKKIRLNRDAFLASKNLSITISLEEAISDLMKKHGTVTSPDTQNFLAGKYADAKTNYQVYIRGNKREGEVGDSHRFVNHTTAVIERFKYILKEEKRNQNISDAVRSKFNLKKRTLIPLDGKIASPTLSTIPDDYIHYQEPRVFTVRECARIQGFPDSFIFKGKYTTGGKLRKKEVPRYTQIGNAIPPLFGEQSGIALKELL